MDGQVVVAYLFALLLVYVLFRLLYGPLRLLLRITYRTALGAAMLWALNLGGSLLGYHFAINLPTSMTAGLLGIPGILALYFLQRLTQ